MENGRNRITFLCLLLLNVEACVMHTVTYENGKQDTSAYTELESNAPVSGIGVGTKDIVAMTDQMMRDMVGNWNPPDTGRIPAIIIDSEYFVNEGTSRLNKNLLTDRLRVLLSRAARNRFKFVSREFAAAVVDEGVRKDKERAVADYRLIGRIATLDAVGQKEHAKLRYHQITFELLDLRTGGIAWNGIYEFQKMSTEDVIYR